MIMIIYYSFANLLFLAIFIVGIGFIVGAIRREPILFNLPNSDHMVWPKFLQSDSNKYLMVYYLALGVVFVITAAVLAIVVNRW